MIDCDGSVQEWHGINNITVNEKDLVLNSLMGWTIPVHFQSSKCFNEQVLFVLKYSKILTF